MSLPPLTYTGLTSYFRSAALSHTGGVSAGQITSALTSLLQVNRPTSGFGNGFNNGFNNGFGSFNGFGTSFDFGVAPVQSTITGSLTAAQASVSRIGATATGLDNASHSLTQLGQIVGSLAPSAGGPFGEATTLPAVGAATAIPNTLQGNINRAQRAAGLAGTQQTQENTAAQSSFNTLRSQAQGLITGLQGVQLSNGTNQSAFNQAIGDIQAALGTNNLDPNRVRTLTFAPATGGGAFSPGTFDASTSAGRIGARSNLDSLAHAISNAQAALAPTLATAHQQLSSAQSVVTQLNNFQSQVNSNSFSLGNNAFGVPQLFQFPRGGLVNVFA